jgi:hypothetical protein
MQEILPNTTLHCLVWVSQKKLDKNSFMEKTFSELEQLGPTDLIAFINDCIQHDFNKLVQLLYRIDVSEEKLKYILQLNPNEDAAKLIAAVILERLAATKAARASFSNTGKIDQADSDNNEASDEDLERF